MDKLIKEADDFVSSVFNELKAEAAAIGDFSRCICNRRHYGCFGVVG